MSDTVSNFKCYATEIEINTDLDKAEGCVGGESCRLIHLYIEHRVEGEDCDLESIQVITRHFIPNLSTLTPEGKNCFVIT